MSGIAAFCQITLDTCCYYNHSYQSATSDQGKEPETDLEPSAAFPDRNVRRLGTCTWSWAQSIFVTVTNTQDYCL